MSEELQLELVIGRAPDSTEVDKRREFQKTESA
jgi:hypothetical protein